MRWQGASGWSALATALICAVACSGQPVGPGRVTAAELRAAVVPELRDRIDASGRFTLSSSSPTSITPKRAIELAEGWRAAFAGSRRQVFERERGESITLGELTADPRVYLSDAPYTIEGEVPKSFRKAYSAYYIVQFRDRDSMPVMSVAVSAMADDLFLQDGMVRFPLFGSGNEFAITGIPADNRDGWPMSPERVAVRAHSLTGVEVAAVPRLLLQGATATRARVAPQHSLWQITLGRPVAVTTRRTRAAFVTNEIFIDAWGKPHVAHGQQPDEISRHFVDVARNGERRVGMARLVRRADSPIEFEPVAITPTK